MFYSIETGGFYSPVINGRSMPGDAIELTADEYAKLRDGLAQGKVVAMGSDGRLVLAPAPAVPFLVNGGAVDSERDRRIDAGVTFNGVLYQSKSADRESISGAAQLALMAIVLNGAQVGDLRWSRPDVDFEWIAADNSRVPMDAQTMTAFATVLAQRKDDLVKAGSDLKAMTVIPQDYTSDKWWP